VHRFFVPGLGTKNHVWLEGPEAHHALKVMRVGVGDQVALFDGSGVECVGMVERADRRGAKIAIARRERPDRDPSLAVTVACAIVKARAMERLVEACSELGARQIIPVETRRCVPKVSDKEAHRLARWERIAVEASKQCGRATVTRIAPPRPLSALLAKAARWDVKLVFSPHEGGMALREALKAHPVPRSVVYLIGPEGGLERGEVRAAEAAGFETVRLGKSTLRSETAAAAALAAILYHYE